MVNHYPAFTIHPGESGATAVRRLLAMVPDVLFFRGSCAYLKNPQASDDSQYSYGLGHSILHGRYVSQAPAVNRVQVFGSGVMKDGLDWESIAQLYDRLLQVHDLNLATMAEAEERAQAEFRRAQLAALAGEMAVPANCGQELYDVVDITDPRAGLSQARRRILGLSLLYHRGGATPRYQHRLLLGGV
jgi:hypothetical protein